MVAITDVSNALSGMTQVFGAAGAGRVAELRARLAAHRAEQKRRNNIVAELTRFSDRELADLGFSRADFPAIANGTYAR